MRQAAKKEKLIPYSKLSRKKRLELDLLGRQTWGEINPVTRCPEHSRVYRRQAENRRWKAEQEHGSARQGGFFVAS